MKWLKRILLGFLNILLINFIILLTLSFNFKNLLTEGIIKEIVKQQASITTEEAITENNLEPLIENENVKKILESEDVNSFLDKYLDLTINSMLDKDNLEKIEIEEDLITILDKNRSVLENKLGKKVTEEIINNVKEQRESKELSKIYKQTIENSKKELPEEVKLFLSIYEALISTTLRVILSIAIIIDLILIMVITKSFYKFLKSLGISLIISGILLMTMFLSLNIIILLVTALNSINITPYLTIASLYIAVGIILLIIKK